MTALNVYPAVRHVRLTADHAQLLLGRTPRALHRLSDGVDAADAVVEVKGPGGVLTLVRVLLPATPRTLVYLCAADAEAVGLRHLSSTIAGSPGCTLSGPQGSVILAEGVLAAERVVLAGATLTRVDVHIEGERPRVLRNVAVESADAPKDPCVYVVDVTGDVASF